MVNLELPLAMLHIDLHLSPSKCRRITIDPPTFHLFLSHVTREVIDHACTSSSPSSADPPSVDSFEWADSKGGRHRINNDVDFEQMRNNCVGNVVQMYTLTAGGRPKGMSDKRQSSEEANGMDVHPMDGSTSLHAELNPLGVRAEQLHRLNVLGSGQVLDPINDMIMAMKYIPLTADEQTQQQILSEMQIAKRCRSAYIVEFHAALFTEEYFSLCFEFMDGGSIEDYKFPPRIVPSVALCMLNGLLYLWGIRVMHRDMKPSNVLVNSKGHVKLCDLGVSTQLTNTIARAQSYVGTSAYMAPEKLAGSDYTIASDVWSFGLSVAELALGKYPFDVDSSSDVVTQLLDRIHKQVMPDWKLVLNTQHRSIVELVVDCVRVSVKERATPWQLRECPLTHDLPQPDHAVIAAFIASINPSNAQ